MVMADHKKCRDVVDQDRLWTRLFRAFDKGKVLLTAGTGALSEDEEDGTGLTGEHDYAILDLRDDHKVRSLLIKNPWARPTIWTGSEKLKSTLHSDDIRPESHILLPGSFWMNLDTLCKNFESLYLNWNPDLFLFRKDIHFRWRIGHQRHPVASLKSNPQFAIRSERGGVVWVLLSRHLQTSQGIQARIAQAETVTDGYLSLCAFDNDGQRVVVEKDSITSTPFIDSPNVLLKLDMRSKVALTIALLCQQVAHKNLNFSISALAIDQCEFSFAEERYTYHSIQKGAWDASHISGNSTDNEDRMESRYILKLSQASAVYALLESDAEDLPMKVELSKLRAARGNPDRHTLVGNSGSRHSGPQFVQFSRIDPGAYMVICSTHRSRQSAKFKLEVGTQQAFSIQPALLEDAGRLTSSLEVVTLSCRKKRVAAKISLCDVTGLAVRAWRPSTSSPFRLAIEEGRRPYATTLAEISPVQQDGQRASMITSTVNVHPKTCSERGLYVVLEALTFSALEEAEIQVNIQLISDADLVAGPWHQIM